MARVTEPAGAAAREPGPDRPDDTDGTGRAEIQGVVPAAPNAVRVRLAQASATGPVQARTVAVLAQRQALVDGDPVEAAIRDLGGGRHVLDAGGDRIPVAIEPARAAADGTRTHEVLVDGFRFVVEVEPERRAALRERAARGRASSGGAGLLEIRAVIPGRVLAVSVIAGDRVATGQQLVVVEAMKMQNELRAPRDGTIERVGVAEGAKIEIGDVLVVIAQEGAG